MYGCSRLSNIPLISSPNIDILQISGTSIDVLPTITHWPRLRHLYITNNENLKTLPPIPTNIHTIDLRNSGIQTISFIRGLHMLYNLQISHCRNLLSLLHLPPSLRALQAHDCSSLETVSFETSNSNANLNLVNCFKLDKKTRETITQRPIGSSILPGSEMPARFNQRFTGNTLTLPSSTISQVCLVICPNQVARVHNEIPQVYCRRIREGYTYPILEIDFWELDPRTPPHLSIFDFSELRRREVSRKIVYEFTCAYNIIECGAQISTYESNNRTGITNRIHMNQDQAESSDEEGYIYEYREASKD